MDILFTRKSTENTPTCIVSKDRSESNLLLVFNSIRLWTVLIFGTTKEAARINEDALQVITILIWVLARW